MATFQLEIVTPEKKVYAGEVNSVLAWGVEGQLGILPHHAPLMTMLQPGDLLIRKEGQEDPEVLLPAISCGRTIYWEPGQVRPHQRDRERL